MDDYNMWNNILVGCAFFAGLFLGLIVGLVALVREQERNDAPWERFR